MSLDLVEFLWRLKRTKRRHRMVLSVVYEFYDHTTTTRVPDFRWQRLQWLISHVNNAFCKNPLNHINYSRAEKVNNRNDKCTFYKWRGIIYFLSSRYSINYADKCIFEPKRIIIRHIKNVYYRWLVKHYYFAYMCY